MGAEDHDDELARSIRLSGLQRLAKVFHDLSPRAHFFRSKLLEEFQLTDSITDAKIVQTPIYASHDISDDDVRVKIMENPYTLIKFKLFKRTLSADEADLIDRRLTRTKNIGSLPIGAWAAWVVKHDIFQGFMMFLIFLNCICFVLEVELNSNEKENHRILNILSLIEVSSLFLLSAEIILKLIDNYRAFFSDGWDLFDFTLLFLSWIPAIVEFVNGGQDTDIKMITSNLKVLRVLRTFKIVPRFPSLKIIVTTIIGTMKSMAVILVLLFISAYIFAILAVSLFNPTSYPPGIIVKNLKEYYNRWSNVGEALKTLFQIFTHDKWIYIMYELAIIVNPTVAYVFVLLWVWVGGFIFRNIFIGVLVSNFEKISVKVSERQAELEKARKYEQLKKRLNMELNAQGDIQNRDIPEAEMYPGNENMIDVVPEEQEEENQVQQQSAMAFHNVGDLFGLSEEPESSSPREEPDLNESAAPASNLNAYSFPNAVQEEDESAVGFVANRDQELENGELDGFPQDQDEEESESEHESEDEAAKVVEKIGDLLALSDGVSRDWENTIAETLNALANCDRTDTFWPRDTIFAYFRAMEALQENLKEFEELQNLARSALLELHDD